MEVNRPKNGRAYRIRQDCVDKLCNELDKTGRRYGVLKEKAGISSNVGKRLFHESCATQRTINLVQKHFGIELVRDGTWDYELINIWREQDGWSYTIANASNVLKGWRKGGKESVLQYVNNMIARLNQSFSG